MNLDLTNKNALVCGSTAGIGKATAIELASMGATVTLVARNEEKLKETLIELPFESEEDPALSAAQAVPAQAATRKKPAASPAVVPTHSPSKAPQTT